MARITRTQHPRLIASGIAFFLMAALMMPTATDARSGGGRHGGHAHRSGGLGIVPSHFAVAPGVSIVRHRFSVSQRHVALRHSRVIGSNLFPLDAGGVWTDAESTPVVVVITQGPEIMQEPAAARHAAAVRTPSAPQDGIVVVRGNSKTYVTFPAAKSG